TMVLETTFTTATGSAAMVDALLLGVNEHGHNLGRDTPCLLLRQLKGLTGQVELELEYVPRTEYGLTRLLLSHTDGGITGIGGADITVLSTPVDLSIRAGTAVGSFSIAADEQIAFGLHYGQPGGQTPRVWPQRELAERLVNTVACWRTWSGIHQ